ncbi:Rap guanine nucleotide exchange factor 1 [Sarotherodon galilaeus]
MKQAWRRSRPQTSTGPPERKSTRRRTEGPPHPRRDPTKPRGRGPTKQPLRVSQYMPGHPSPDTENHQYNDGWGHQPPAGSVVGGDRPPYLGGGLRCTKREQRGNRRVTLRAEQPYRNHISNMYLMKAILSWTCCRVLDHSPAAKPNGKETFYTEPSSQLKTNKSTQKGSFVASGMLELWKPD